MITPARLDDIDVYNQKIWLIFNHPGSHFAFGHLIFLMPGLFLHVGQCGNQIGREIWERLSYEVDASTENRGGNAGTSSNAPSPQDLGYFVRTNHRGEHSAPTSTSIVPIPVNESA